MQQRTGLNDEATNSTAQVRADAETARSSSTQFDPAQLTPTQLDGIACVRCHAENDAMLPVGTVPGHGQVFACVKHAEPADKPQIPAAWEEEARKAGEQAAFRVRVSYDAEMRAYEHERATKPTAYWLASHPCPPWCTNGDIHRSSDHPDDRVHDSDVHAVSLHTMEPGTFFAEFAAPELTMMLTQRYREGEPRVFINDSGDDTRLYATLDEAELIANTLLTLVAQARGQANSST